MIVIFIDIFSWRIRIRGEGKKRKKRKTSLVKNRQLLKMNFVIIFIFMEFINTCSSFIHYLRKLRERKILSHK